MKTVRIAENIKFYRNIRKISQTELAKKLNLKDRTNISNYENGANFPTLERIIKLSEIFGITLDELVFGYNTQDNFSNIDINKDIKNTVPIFNLMFRPIYSPTATIDKTFMKAYECYSNFLNNIKKSHVDFSTLKSIYNLFLDSWENNQTIESAANLIKILFLQASEYIPVIYNGEISPIKPLSIKRFLLGLKEITSKTDAFYSKNEEKYLELMSVLRNNSNLKDLADFFHALSYLFGFNNSQNTYAINTMVFEELISFYYDMGNKYAIEFIDHLIKIVSISDV